MDAGASLLTIHGRTRDEKGHQMVAPDWDMIRRVKAHFVQRGCHVPIMANGGIETMEDVERCLAITGADGVMTSEGILENPAIFSRGIDANGRYRDCIDLAEEYFELCDIYPQEHIRFARSHMMKLLYRYINSHTDIRDLIALTHSTEDFKKACTLCRELQRTAQQQGRSYDDQSWYRRHRTPTHAFSGRVDPESIRVRNLEHKKTSVFWASDRDRAAVVAVAADGGGGDDAEALAQAHANANELDCEGEAHDAVRVTVRAHNGDADDESAADFFSLLKM